MWPPLSERVQFCVYAAERKTNKRCEMTESCEVLGEGEAGAGRPPYLPSLPTRCPQPSPGHNLCDSALAKMHRLVEVTVSAYFNINVNVSPTVSQPVCVCVCAQRLLPCPGHSWRSPRGRAGAAKAPSGSCAQPDPCSSFNSCWFWGCFCLFFLLSPCRSGCCTHTCEHGAAGEGDWFILALDRTSACVGFLRD